MNKKILLNVANMSKVYQNRAVVQDVSFTLAGGEILALLGPNGAGKTTIVKMLLGLVTPTSGVAEVMGHNMSLEKERRYGVRHIGAVLEGSRNTYWRLSALENLRYFGGIRGLSRKQVDEKAYRLLNLLGLVEVADQEVRHYSRGMQQKVALANALMHDPEVLILDEPTLGLDVEAAKLLEETIVRLAEQGQAILLTTHVMTLAERLATKIFVLSGGHPVAYDQTQALLQQFDTRTIVEIKLKEMLSTELGTQLAYAFPGIKQNGRVLEWVEPEQSQIVQMYDQLDRANQTVLSVSQREPKLEEIFLSLTSKQKAEEGARY